MIDLHCHILPALDDGALDLDDAVAMARPGRGGRHHDDLRHTAHPARPRRGDRRAGRESRGAERRVRAARRRRPGGGRRRGGRDRGAPVWTTRSCARCRSAAAGAGSCSSPRPGPLGDSLDATVEDALAQRGFRSVIAHPERHADERLRGPPRLPRRRGRARAGHGGDAGARARRAGDRRARRARPGAPARQRRAQLPRAAGRCGCSAGARGARAPPTRVAPHLDWISTKRPRRSCAATTWSRRSPV